MSAIDQLRCLGDDEPESIFWATPLWEWQKKQVVSVESVNIFIVIDDLYRTTIALSPTLTEATRKDPNPILSDEMKNMLRQYAPLMQDPKPGEFLWLNSLRDVVRRQVEAAEAAEDLEEMRAPTAFGW